MFNRSMYNTEVYNFGFLGIYSFQGLSLVSVVLSSERIVPYFQFGHVLAKQIPASLLNVCLISVDDFFVEVKSRAFTLPSYSRLGLAHVEIDAMSHIRYFLLHEGLTVAQLISDVNLKNLFSVLKDIISRILPDSVFQFIAPSVEGRVDVDTIPQSLRQIVFPTFGLSHPKVFIESKFYSIFNFIDVVVTNVIIDSQRIISCRFVDDILVNVIPVSLWFIASPPGVPTYVFVVSIDSRNIIPIEQMLYNVLIEKYNFVASIEKGEKFVMFEKDFVVSKGR